MTERFRPDIWGIGSTYKGVYKLLDMLKEDGNPIAGFRKSTFRFEDDRRARPSVSAACTDGHEIALCFGTNEELDAELARLRDIFASWKKGVPYVRKSKRQKAADAAKRRIGDPPDGLGRVTQIAVSPTKIGESGDLLYVLTESGSVWTWDVHNHIWGQVLQGPQSQPV